MHKYDATRFDRKYWRRTILAVLLVATVAVAPIAGSVTATAQEGDAPAPPERWNVTVGGDGDDKLTTGVRTDDGYLVVGWTNGDDGSDDGYVAMVDEAGETAWERSYGGAGTDRIFDVETVEDGYLVAGYSSPDAGSAWDGWVMKLGPDGDKQWERTYGGDDASVFWSLATSGDAVYAGGYQKGSSADAWLVELDAGGDKQWEQTYDTLRSGADERIDSLFVDDSGDLLLVGNIEPSTYDPSDAWVMRVDGEGELQWEQTYGGTAEDKISDAAATTDGGYVLAGRTASQGDGATDGWLLKIDGDGEKRVERTYGTERDDAFYGVLADDGEFVLSGAKHKESQNGADGWVLKADGSGHERWEQTYGNQYWDKFWPTVAGHDGGYLAVGESSSYSDTKDGWLVRVGGPASAAIRDSDADAAGTTVALDGSPVRSVTLADANVSGVLTVSERANLSALSPPGDPVYGVTVTGPESAADDPATVELSVPTDAGEVRDLRVAQQTDDGWTIRETRVVSEANGTAVLSADIDGTGTLAVTEVAAPTATIGGDRAVLAGETAELSAAESSAENGTLVDYRWSVAGEELAGETASVSFDEPGVRDVTLTVTDSAGLNATRVGTLVVNDRPEVAVDAPDAVEVGTAATFSADVSNDVGNATVTWKFGDGEVTGESVEHSFGDAGTRTVEVVVEDEYGATVTESVTVDVGSQDDGGAETSGGDDGGSGTVPGFGALAALVALAGTVLAAKLKRN